MEKQKVKAIIRLIVSALLLSALLSILVTGLKNKDRGFPFLRLSIGGKTYENAEKYVAGDTSFLADKLEKININWVNGELHLETYDGDKIEIKETCSSTLTEEHKVYSYYEDGTLHIQPRRSEHFTFLDDIPYKSLVIRIPNKLNNDSDAILKSLNLEIVGADTTINGLAIQHFKTDTVSGNLTFNGSIEKMEYDAVSGDLNLTSDKTPHDIDFDSVSGDAIINVPENSVFSIEHDGVSSDLNNEFPTTTDEDNDWDFDTVSGDVTIRKNK